MHHELHGFYVPLTVTCKLSVMVYYCLHATAPQYLSELCTCICTWGWWADSRSAFYAHIWPVTVEILKGVDCRGADHVCRQPVPSVGRLGCWRIFLSIAVVLGHLEQLWDHVPCNLLELSARWKKVSALTRSLPFSILNVSIRCPRILRCSSEWMWSCFNLHSYDSFFIPCTILCPASDLLLSML